MFNTAVTAMVGGGGGAFERAKALPNLLQILSDVDILRCKYFIINIWYTKNTSFCSSGNIVHIVPRFSTWFVVFLSRLGGVHQK